MNGVEPAAGGVVPRSVSAGVMTPEPWDTRPEAVPTIYVREPVRRRATGWDRALALGIAVGCLAVLLIAARVRPDGSGMGSHTSLGLQPCGFLAQTGLPCPTCGMTTSYAWFVRGNLPASFYVQPMGTVLAVLTACGVWLGLYVAATGRPVYRLFDRLGGHRAILALMALAVAAWAWKIFLTLPPK